MKGPSATGPRRVLLVDLGNTSATLAMARDGALGPPARVSTRLARRREVRAALARLAGGRPADGAVYASVVPGLDRLWLSELRPFCTAEPLAVDWRLALGVRLDYPHPETIGADRLANACGAVVRYGSPVVVADFGTALTFDVIAGNAYRGGLILPGLPLMTEYLAERTALLPSLRLDGARPLRLGRAGPIGKSTRQAMLLGARLGYPGMVREVYERLRRALRAPALRLVATGGYARWALAGAGLPARLDPDLTLFGLLRIDALNRPNPAPGGPA